MVGALFKITLYLLRFLPAEFSSKFSLSFLDFVFRVSSFSGKYLSKSSLKKEILGLNFPNRIGLAAGLDKEGKYFACLGQLGFGFVEVGTFTPLAQKGNEHPRLKRIKNHKSLVNRLGFNNPGIHSGIKNITNLKEKYKGIVGISIGKNKNTEIKNAYKDYLYCLDAAYKAADYIALNISSPNTENLRDLTSKNYLEDLLSKINQRAIELCNKYSKFTPLILKISPDESEYVVPYIIEISLKYNISGFIVSNTTYGMKENMVGGISGSLLKEKSLQMLKLVSQCNKKKAVIISSGGISSKKDLKERYELGADLFQIYTSFVYEGPKILDDLLSDS